MSNIEKDLSEYIDQLNEEKKPKRHGDLSSSIESEELFEAVRLVHSLKEPALPGADYSKKVARTVADQLSKSTSNRKKKWTWFAGMGAVAAVFILAVMLNTVLTFGKTNIVYAMEQAFKDVKAYHGTLEIVETNGEGKKALQTQLEVWADKEGNYFVKALEGSQTGLVTVNNGEKKWQIRPSEKQVYTFSAFPDPYRFVFELGKEIEDVRNAVETKAVGEGKISGRDAFILEVSPQGGVAYKIWIDKETKLPLQKQSGMQNALQYTITYTKIDFSDEVPSELIAYNIPKGFKEVDTCPEQLVNNIEEGKEIVGFTPKVPVNIKEGYSKDGIAIDINAKAVKLYYASQDKQNRVIVLQAKAVGEFKPASRAILGIVGDSTAEIQSPIEGSSGTFAGGGVYAGVTNISSIRWQEAGFEYTILGNISLEDLQMFMKGLTDGVLQIPSDELEISNKPQIEVPVNLEIEKSEQKSVDAGHSPWKLDPAFVAQVFVSLKISPEGISGEYPIKYEDLKIIQNTGKEAMIEVNGNNTPIRRVYLKKLIRHDNTGIWTVVGYDPV